MTGPGRPAALTVAVAVLLALLAGSAWASHSQVELVSIGPAGGNGANQAAFADVSADGTKVFFRTSEALVSSDTDDCPTQNRRCNDMYQRSGGETELLSIGPTGGNGSFDVFHGGISEDGSRIFFTTIEPLVAEDAEGGCEGASGFGPCLDVYERRAGSTTLISTGPNRGNGPWRRYFAGSSADGSRVFFSGTDSLTGSDSDSFEDLYEHAGGSTAHVSTGPGGGNGAFEGLFSGSSEDGSRIFFRTAESLVAADTDNHGDVYQRAGGQTTLVSIGPSGGNGAASSGFEAASADGSKVFFTTTESLVTADTDSAEDVYERSSGTTSLVSTGPSGNGIATALFDGISKDGSRVFFRTRSSLTPADTDSTTDLYERSGGATTLLSTGPAGGNGAHDVHFAGASKDGSRVFFTTRESLVSSDTDTRLDVYERVGSATSLVSTAPAGGNGAVDAYFVGASADGVRVFFHTTEALVGADTDTFQDVYERFAGATTLISTGPAGGNGSHSAFYVDASDDGTHVFFQTGEKLVSGDTDTHLDVYESRAFTGYARPKAATPAFVSLVVAYRSCDSANALHGPPLVAGSCVPPVPESDHLTVGTADVNGQPTLSSGYVLMRAVCNPAEPGSSPSCTPPGDQGDVSIEIAVTDVRRKDDLSDYAGELQAVLGLRITDRLNGPSLQDPGTATDVPFSISVPCSQTPGQTIGSTCNTATTADAVLGGVVVEGRRSIWALGQVEVRDGGPDGDADTAPNTTFLRQGVFVP